MTRNILIATVALLWSAGAIAAQRTVILTVENLYCASCPYIVKQTLAQVPGVSMVEISFRNKTSVVTFDDAKADVAALTRATRTMGFPSALRDRMKHR